MLAHARPSSRIAASSPPSTMTRAIQVSLGLGFELVVAVSSCPTRTRGTSVRSSSASTASAIASLSASGDRSIVTTTADARRVCSTEATPESSAIRATTSRSAASVPGSSTSSPSTRPITVGPGACRPVLWWQLCDQFIEAVVGAARLRPVTSAHVRGEGREQDAAAMKAAALARRKNGRITAMIRLARRTVEAAQRQISGTAAQAVGPRPVLIGQAARAAKERTSRSRSSSCGRADKSPTHFAHWSAPTIAAHRFPMLSSRAATPARSTIC
jgi:hypothetical protein